jgi:hypothetical protein
MNVKRGPRLSDVSGFPPVIAERLAALSISTAEEFVSQTISDPEGLRTFVGLDDRRFSDVVELAESVLGPEVVAELRAFQPTEHSYGALNPHPHKEDYGQAQES